MTRCRDWVMMVAFNIMGGTVSVKGRQLPSTRI